MEGDILFERICIVGDEGIFSPVWNAVSGESVSVHYLGDNLENLDISVLGEGYLLLDFHEDVKSDSDRVRIRQSAAGLSGSVDSKRIILNAQYVGDEASLGPLRRLYFDLIVLFPGINIVSYEEDHEYDEETYASERFKEELLRIIRSGYATKLNDFRIITDVSGNYLNARIELTKALKDVPEEQFRYRFFVLRDSEVVYREGSSRNKSISFEMTEPGSYVVQGYVHAGHYNVFRLSDSYFHSTEESRESYEKFKKNAEGLEYDELEPVPSQEPFQDFLVLSGDGFEPSGAISEFKLESVQHDGPGTVRIYARHSNGGGGVSVFSGFAKFGDSLLFGPSCDEHPSEDVSGCAGCFTYVDVSEKIRIGKDFMGYGHIWYYSGDGLVAVSNNYVLLIEALSEKLDLRPDWPLIRSSLSVIHWFFFSQRFTHQMDVVGIKQLPVYSDLTISADGRLEIVPNSTGCILEDKRVLDYESYHSLLQDSIREIEENISCIPWQSGQNVSVELTGGMDSRLVYSVFTRLPDCLNKVSIVTHGENEDMDVKLAARICAMFDTKYDDATAERSCRSYHDADMIRRNHEMGTVYSEVANPYVYAKPNIRVSGGTGDGLCRAVYGKFFFDKAGGRSETVDDIVDWWEGWIARHKIFGDEQSHSDASARLEEELNSMGGGSCLEKMDLMYLCFRNCYHFDPSSEMGCGTLVWMPLQSKTLLLLNHLTHDSFRGTKLENDLITAANPACMAVPYDKERDINWRNQNQAIFREIPPWVESLKVPDESEKLSERESANARAKSRLLNKKDPKFSDPSCLFDETLARLGILARRYENELGSDVMQALFYYYNKNKESKGRIELLNHKVTSILDQLHLIEM